MDQLEQWIISIKESHLLIASFLFILVHVIRPIFFIPVILIIMTGGVIFGFIHGMLLSIIGLMLSSLIFYFLAAKLPWFTTRLIKMKVRLFGEDRHMTKQHIMLLRLVPFIHYHLLSFLIYEQTDDLKQYNHLSLYTALPMAIIYTVIGQSVSQFSPKVMTTFVIIILAVSYILRKDTRQKIKQLLTST